MTTTRSTRRLEPVVDGWVSVAEVARMLRVTPRTVHRMRADGRIPAEIESNAMGHPRFKLDAIERIMEAGIGRPPKSRPDLVQRNQGVGDEIVTVAPLRRPAVQEPVQEPAEGLPDHPPGTRVKTPEGRLGTVRKRVTSTPADQTRVLLDGTPRVQTFDTRSLVLVS